MQRTCQIPLVLGVNPKIALYNGIGLELMDMAGIYYYNPMTAVIAAVIGRSSVCSYEIQNEI